MAFCVLESRHKEGRYAGYNVVKLQRCCEYGIRDSRGAVHRMEGLDVPFTTADIDCPKQSPYRRTLETF